MEVGAAARKHDVLDQDIRSALATPLRTQLQTNPDTGDIRQLVIGAARDGLLLELVVIHPFTEDATVIHAMPARDTFIK